MGPDPERHRRLRAVFDRAVVLDSTSREAYLNDACAGDPDLRAHAARLLAVHHRADSFLEHPPGLAAAGADLDTFTGTDRFRLVRQLGRGGMGVVYEAHDAQRDEVVALKTLRRAGAIDLYRLKREFRSLADVAHPHLVCLYELFVEDDRPFFTMELIHGQNFVEHIRGSRGEPDVARVMPALQQLADGLSALHRRGLLHRDVKPSNVLITRDARTVLLDFGLITETAMTSARDIGGGTPAYMSPEEAAGAPPTEAGDWYGVGASLYEALTGRLPFAGSVASVLRDKQALDPPSPHDLAAGIPHELSALCMGLLHRDPSRRLNGDAVRKLAAPAPPTPTPEHATSRFVGRRDQLAMLGTAAEAVRRGHARTISVFGPSGIGKSALARQFLAANVRSDAVILAGRCYENESVPYKGLDGVVDELARYLAGLPSSSALALLPDGAAALATVFPVLRRVPAVRRLPGEHAGVDPLQLRRRAVQALRAILTRIASQRDLVVWIDDLQWADADSMQILSDVLAAPNAPVMLTLLTFRGEEVQAKPFLQALVDGRDPEAHAVIALDAMTDDEARLLIDALVPSTLDDGDRRRLTREAAGSPFVLEQLAVFAAQQLDSPASSTTLATMFDRRLEALAPQARVFLETLALCGRPMAADLICDASGVGADRRSLLVTLRASHLIRSSGSADRLETYHDRIRETLLARVAPGAARAIHHRVAALLVACRSDDCEALFEHHRGAGDLDLAAVQAGLAADKAAAALAFDRAASFYRQAIDLAPEAAVSSRWQTQLAVALTNAGRPAEAADAYLRASATVSRVEQVVLHRAAAEQFLIGGHIDRGLALLRDVLQRVDVSFPSSPRVAAARLVWRRARLWWRGLHFESRAPELVDADTVLRLDACWAAGTGLALVDIARACEFLARHLHLALDAGELSRIARGSAVEFSARSADWPYRRSARQFETLSAALSARVDTPLARATQLLADSIAACATGQWTRAQASSARSLTLLREQCVGVNWEMTIAQNMFIWSLMYRGQLGELSSLVPAVLDDARRRGNLYLVTELVTRSNFIWLAADQAEAGEREVVSTMAQWSQKGFHRQHYSAMLARVQTALYRGDPPAAWQVLDDNEAPWRASMLMHVQALRVEYHYMRGRCAIALAAIDGGRNRWLAAARSYARRIARERMPWSNPLARLLEAGIAAVGGDVTAADHALAEAITQFERADMELYANVARRSLGGLRDGETGRDLLRQADAWMASQQIKNPASFTRMLAPGFTTSCHNAAMNRQA
jgi:hypothetical protein